MSRLIPTWNAAFAFRANCSRRSYCRGSGYVTFNTRFGVCQGTLTRTLTYEAPFNPEPRFRGDRLERLVGPVYRR